MVNIITRKDVQGGDIELHYGTYDDLGGDTWGADMGYGGGNDRLQWFVGASYFKHSTVIPGLPPALHLLVVPIEFFSTFILRPVTLALRLMANFLAGHLILVLLYSATNFFFFQFNAWTAVGGLTLVAAVLFTLYELIVIFLQAYIFALLTAVYIELSLHADSH